jgi:DNA-binding NarL/FixJ family response regulator
LLGLVEQQLVSLQIAPDKFYYFNLSLLEGDLSPQLAEAVERGRKRDVDSVVKEVMSDLSQSRPEPQSPDDLLTEREIEIIHLIAEGLNSREAAEQIHLSVTTVRWYLRQIYSKLDVHSRTELIARARELELLP